MSKQEYNVQSDSIQLTTHLRIDEKAQLILFGKWLFSIIRSSAMEFYIQNLQVKGWDDWKCIKLFNLSNIQKNMLKVCLYGLKIHRS